MESKINSTMISGSMNWIKMIPYFNNKNVCKKSSGWQINLLSDLTSIYPKEKLENIIQLSEEQLRYALNLIKKAKIKSVE